MEIKGNLVNVKLRKIYPVKIYIENKKIKKITHLPEGAQLPFILPGFVDAHVHIESSMLTPVNFGKLAVRHGTVGVVADPHEIANVAGIPGIEYMMDNAAAAPVKIRFGVPSCVPATPLESGGAALGIKEVNYLLQKHPEMHLAEMMNYPGVINEDPEVIGKIGTAKRMKRIIDGHAPGLTGKDLRKYVKKGIETDHECATLPEALEKASLGMNILIREGSAAKNFDALIPLIKEYPNQVMFCTDDAHPDELLQKHIRNLVLRAWKKGYDFWDVLRAATVNPVEYYKLNIGLLREGDPADFIVCSTLENLYLEEVFLEGKKVWGENSETEKTSRKAWQGSFPVTGIKEKDLKINQPGRKQLQVILAQEGSLLTGRLLAEPLLSEDKDEVISDPSRDILKIVVINRYVDGLKPALGFVRGFGLSKGAMASSIAHDSHNLIAVGVEDKDIVAAVNRVIHSKGGIAVSGPEGTMVLPLPVAGLMSEEDGEVVAEKYKALTRQVQRYGSHLHAPFMTLSFMALLVIPELKIGDKGLFDVNRFVYTDLWA